MQRWGVVFWNETRGHFAVKGKWQGKRRYFSQIPVRGGRFLTCTSREMADYLQEEISKEITRGCFNPSRYQHAQPLHMGHYAPRWLELKRPNLAGKTAAIYQTYISTWIIPGLGNEYLPDINHEKIMAFLNGIDRSSKYKRNIYGCLREILSDACKSGYISQVPEHVTISLEQRRIEWLGREQQEAILAKIPVEHRHIFRFLFLTGVRPSEARALRKTDIRDDHILIANTFAPVKGGEALKIVKNKKEQAIPLYEAVRRLLDEIPPTLSPFVFLNPETGRPYSKNINRDIWNPASMAALGYVFPMNNAGRHSFANQLLEAGIDIETVSALLRHSSTTVTKSNYARPNLKVIGGAVDRVQGRK